MAAWARRRLELYAAADSRSSPKQPRSTCQKPFENLPKKAQRDADRRRRRIARHSGNPGRDVRQASSEAYREWLMEYMSPAECPDCHGKRLRPSSLAVRVKGVSIAEFTGAVDFARAGDGEELEAQRAREADRRTRGGRNPQPAGISGRRRPGLSEPGPLGRDALRRRGAAHPPGDADRLEAARRAVRARRAVDRTASARQRSAARIAARTCAIWATRCWWWSTTPRPSSAPTT